MKKRYWLLIALLVLIISCVYGYSLLRKEHNEANNIQLNGANYNALTDGKFVGYYEGGMYKWRENRVEIIIEKNKLREIKLLESSDPGKENSNYKELFNRVIENQSLNVDAISGATLTSKGILKSIEIALIKSNKEEK